MGGLFTGPPKLPLSGSSSDVASWRRPGRQSTVLAMLEPPDAEGGAAHLPPPSPPANQSSRGYVQLASNTTTATDGYEVAEDNARTNPPGAATRNMRLSPSGADFIKGYEKGPDLRGPGLEPYTAVKGGVPTIGWGHQITKEDNDKGKFKQPITRREADELFQKDVAPAERDVNRLTKVPLSQEQFDALVSLRYNLSPRDFGNSRALKYLNAGDFERAFSEWAEFRLGGDPRVPLEGLKKRREAEIEIFRGGMGKN